MPENDRIACMGERIQPEITGHVKDIVNRYTAAYARLRNCEAGSIRVTRHEVIGKSGNRSIGWSFIFPSVSHADGTELILDFDDTQAPTNKGKEHFYTDCSKLLPENVDTEQFVKAGMFVNEAARIYPQSVDLKRYSPLLELRGTSRLIYNLLTNPKYQMPQTSDAARELIGIEAFTLAPDSNGINRWPTLPIDLGDQKFREQEEYSLALEYGENPPDGVYKAVWEKFREHLSRGRVPYEEIQNFNTPEDVWVTTMTFGPLDHQLEKTFNHTQQLVKAGKRIPDEIFVVTEGLKAPFIMQRVKSSPKKRFVFAEDSVAQIEPLVGVDRLTLVHAWRPDIKDAAAELPEGVIRLPIAQTPHTKILTLVRPKQAA